MIPIEKLLSRIHWDPRFRAGNFQIGYYDRVEKRIIVVPLQALHFPPDERSRFELWDEDGVLHRIPFHRVRRVWRNGRLIWQRPPPAPAGRS